MVRMTLRLVAAALLVAVGAIAGEAPPYTEHEASWTNGDLHLAGVFFRPNGNGPFPAAVLIQGSGQSDRTNAWARSWAEALATDGVAALLTDKRGCGNSDGDWRTAGFDELAGDDVAAVNWLRERKDIRGDAVGVIGLSQGGFYAPTVAVKSPAVAFIVSISGAAVTPVDQVNHEMRNTFRQAGLDEAGVEAGMKLQALAADYLKTGDWTAYRAAMDAALASPLKPIAEGFPQTEDSPVWTFWRKVGEFDPITDWKAAKQPGLILYGEDDERDNVPVQASVTRIRALVDETGRDISVHVYPGSGHGIYAAGTKHLRDDAVETLLSWIDAKTKSPR